MNNWQEEFKNKYYHYQSVYDAFPEYNVGNKILLDDIEAFITTLLQKQREEIKDLKYNDSVISVSEYYSGYNKAVRDVLNIIKSHDNTQT